MLHHFIRLLLCAFLCLGLMARAGAQESDSSGGDALAKAIEQAAESGVGVVIIDSSGRPVPGPGRDSADLAPGSSDHMESPSMLMKAQSEVGEFRSELRSRLEALPYSRLEMEYILRETSPDGRIMTFVEVAGWSVLFLLIGPLAVDRDLRQADCQTLCGGADQRAAAGV